jgi:diguanylate cyclase (GGDEF)-like protein
MAHPNPAPAQADSLHQRFAEKVALIDDLWTRLQHVCWKRQSLSVLINLARDLERSTHQSDDPKLRSAAHRFRAYLAEHLELDRPLTGEPGDRVTALIDLLKDVVDTSVAERSGPTPVTVPEFAVGLLCQDPDFRAAMGQELEEAGYRVRKYSSTAAAEAALNESQPAALIAEVSHETDDLPNLHEVGEMVGKLETRVPVIYVSDRGDLAARLAAVRNGGQGFFVRPTNVELILSRLRVVTGRSDATARVLVVSPDSDLTRRVTETLAQAQMECIRLEQPQLLLSAVHRNRPDMIVVDLDLGDLDGSEAIQVLRQHQAEVGQVPIVCLDGAGEPGARMLALSAGADAVLTGKQDLDELLVTIRSRVRRIRARRSNEAATSATAGVEHLGNRQRFLANVEHALQGVGIQRSAVAVLLVSVDNFRALREHAGMYGCDRIMMQVARRIGRLLRSQDKLLRHSDSSFAVLACNLDGEALEKFAGDLSKAVEKRPFAVGDEGQKATVSIGVVVSTHEHTSPLALIENADLAARIARDELSRLHIHCAVSDRSAEVERDEAMVRQVKDALDKYRYRLLFQPIVSLGNNDQERYEAFLRMQDAAGADMFPETIFRVADQQGFATRIDRVVVAEALKLMYERKEAGHTTQLMVNICAPTMANKGFPKWLGEQIQRYQLEPGQVILKVSEAAVLEHVPSAVEFAEATHALGCQTGIRLTRLNRERLELLSRMAPRFIQLNHQLIPELSGTPDGDSSFRTVLDSATDHEIQVIVSHVEDPKTLSGLWRCGVNFAQGNFLQEAFPEMSYDFDGI